CARWDYVSSYNYW
nr:immunoglobulin heavy chain junction region [Mus musculus]